VVYSHIYKMTSTSPSPQGKIQHLKKADGQPLWRKDIQFDFLHSVFSNEQKVFQSRPLVSKGCMNPPSTPELKTFCQVYVDAMAASPKCSKILREKLLYDSKFACNVGMVCLLVNLGRMNTTLNFFPEMKAQLRTYHSIPSLQQADQSSQKQLQDAPRLKSILKGACEEEPSTLEAMLSIPVTEFPRTNPINLSFVLSTFAPKVSEMHFANGDFWDLLMTPGYSSKSRANDFLWLMWWWMHSPSASMDLKISTTPNPFGGYENTAPRLEPISHEVEALENIDTAEEIKYGEMMVEERRRLLQDTPRQKQKTTIPVKKPVDRAVRTSTRSRKRKFSLYDASESEEEQTTPPPLQLRLKVQRVSPTRQTEVDNEVARLIAKTLEQDRQKRWKEGRILREWRRKEDESVEEAKANFEMWDIARQWVMERHGGVDGTGIKQE